MHGADLLAQTLAVAGINRLRRFETDGPVYSSPAVAYDVVYVGSELHLYVIGAQFTD